MGAEGDAFQRAAARLSVDGPPRVWSLVVTLFGDMAQARDARLSGATLTRLAGLVDIRAEAMRVALHRLRRDGWIETERSGREVRYRLSAYGRRQSAAATPRIYAEAPPERDDWHVLIAGSGEARGARALDDLAVSEGYVPLGPAAVLGHGPLPSASQLVAVAAGGFEAPDWLRRELCPPDLVAAAAALERAVRDVGRQLPEPPGFGPLEVAALRMLAVHEWRRVVLRVPEVPAALLPRDWRGEAVRTAVSALLARLPPPAIPALEAAAREG